MGSDEDRAFEILKVNREIHRQQLAKFNGTLIKEMGDGMLTSFNLASEAVRCAIAIQKACREQDIPLKIGIHEGEMVFEGQDVLGDGVNIASRIQEGADEGCILISGAVYRDIRNKTDIRTSFLEERSFKNVDEPVRIYQVLSGDEPIPNTQPPVPKNHKSQIINRKLIWGVAGMMVIVAAAILVWQFFSGDQISPSNAGSSRVEIDKSIAVLPFTNLSNDPDQEYFSDGMMDEILNHLFQIGDLQVTSRTSVMQYRNTTKTIPQIAQELGVSAILEGSVRKSGNRIRITAQLIDGRTDKHLWSEIYEREIKDVFAVQSEVAQVIASTLNAEITPEVKQRIESIPTKSIEAYDLYLRGIGTIELNMTVSHQQEGNLVLLKEAVEKDNSFAEAYAMLGFLTIFQAGFIADKNPSVVAKEAKEYLDKALILDPQSSLAHVTMANYLTWYAKDFKQAEMHYRLGIELAPSNVVSFVSIIDLLLALGRFEEALKYSEKALELDATNYDYWGRNALVHAFIGNDDEMSENIAKARRAGSEFIVPFTESARAYLIRGKYDKALEILSQRDNLMSFPRTMGIKSITFFKLGDQENHLKELNKLIQRAAETAGGSPSFYTAMVYASKGEKEEAFRWLDNSCRHNEVELYWLKVEPEFTLIHSDPRWQAMLDKMGFPETEN